MDKRKFFFQFCHFVSITSQTLNSLSTFMTKIWNKHAMITNHRLQNFWAEGFRSKCGSLMLNVVYLKTKNFVQPFFRSRMESHNWNPAFKLQLFCFIILWFQCFLIFHINHSSSHNLKWTDDGIHYQFCFEGCQK